MNNWIQLHTSLLTHRKVKRVTNDLAIPPVLVRGHLATLWLNVAQQAPTGELVGWDDHDVELAAEWGGVHGALCEGLVSAGLLSKTPDGFTVRDWDVYYGLADLEKRRAGDRERQRRHRQKQKENEDANVTSRHVTPRVTQEERRGEEKRGEESTYCSNTSQGAEPPETKPSPRDASLWEDGNLPAVLEHLAATDAPDQLFDPGYWKRILNWLGDHPSVAVLDELDKYLAWLESKPKRHRDLKRGFRNWLSKAEFWRDKDAQRQQERNARKWR